MTPGDLIRRILENCRAIAVYGMSRNPAKAAHWVPRYMAQKGYRIIPVNPSAETILGLRSYPDLASVPEPIDVVQVFRRSEDALKPVREAVARKKERGDVSVVWLQQGIRSEEARKLAEQEGLLFVQDRCMYHEHRMLNPMDE